MDTEEIYYVYLHRRATDNEVFYVGKGKNNRATSKVNRNSWWQSVVEKHGYIVEYVESNLSESDAFELEAETIKFYKSNGHTLTNLTEGGGGVAGYKRTVDQNEAFKAVLRKKVLCSNGMIFDSCLEAEAWLGRVPTTSKVSKCCRRKLKQVGGFVWRHLEDSDDLRKIMAEGKDALAEMGCRAYDAGRNSSAKAVYCSNGKWFHSMYAAAKWLSGELGENVKQIYISKVCNGLLKSFRGLKFSFSDDFNFTGVLCSTS